ncbi:MAG: family 20 glycosylhydrolase [Planctomycetota bacterium]|jgi:hexosaminidase
MMTSTRYALIAFIALLGFSTTWGAIMTVPAVQKWTQTEGTVQIGPCAVNHTSSATEAEDYKAVSDLFVRNIEKIIPDDTNEQSKSTFTFVVDETLEAEAYKIDIAKTITIQSSKPQGAFYATQTLLQMLAAAGDGTLPCGHIEDKPLYPVRSVLLDVGRKFMAVEQLKDWIDMMARVKLNELHLHLNDNSWGRYSGYRLESRKYPNLASKDGHYTWQQIRELQDYAAVRGVSIVPEIDSPGHALAFTKLQPELAHPELNHQGFGLCYLDIRKEQTYRFMESILDEVALLFDSKYFHIGTDEYLLRMIQDKTEQEKTGELFREYINHLAKYLEEKHDKTTRIWSGYEHMPGTTEPDTSIVIDMWETTDAVNKSKAGYEFVNSSHFYTYIVPGMPYYGVNNSFIYDTWTPLIFNLKEKTGQLTPEDPGLLGGKLHVWNDGGPTGYTWNEIARLVRPSMAAISEKLWGTKGSADYAAFKKRTASIDKLPQLPLLERTAKADSDGVVFSLDGPDVHFIANTALPLLPDGREKNLEYPWTVSFTVTRQSDAAGDEVLMSSELATFYLDLKHTATDKNTKEEKTQRGVACVRAVQAPGFTPLTSFRPDVLIFDYQVPIGEKVDLTFVGEKGKTSLFTNGKLIQSKDIQMVCPLEFLGSPHNKSFQGILHDIRILNKVVK